MIDFQNILVQFYSNDLENFLEDNFDINNLKNFQTTIIVNFKYWFDIIRVMTHNFDKYRDHEKILYDKVVEFNNQVVELNRFAKIIEIEYNKFNIIYQIFKKDVVFNFQTSHSQNSRRFVIVLDSKKFDDIDKNYLRNFIHLIKNKFENNVDHFIKNIEKVTRNARKIYVWTRIKNIVVDQILSQIIEDINVYEIFHITKEIFDFLKRIWDDFDRQQLAQLFIHNLFQRKSRFRDYFFDFQIHILSSVMQWLIVIIFNNYIIKRKQ